MLRPVTSGSQFGVRTVDTVGSTDPNHLSRRVAGLVDGTGVWSGAGSISRQGSSIDLSVDPVPYRRRGDLTSRDFCPVRTSRWYHTGRGLARTVGPFRSSVKSSCVKRLPVPHSLQSEYSTQTAAKIPKDVSGGDRGDCGDSFSLLRLQVQQT